MVDSYEERKRRARLYALKRKYGLSSSTSTPTINKNIKIRNGNSKNIIVNKKLSWDLGSKHDPVYGRVPKTIEDVHNEIMDIRKEMEEYEGAWWNWETDLAHEINWKDYIKETNIHPLTELQKKFGPKVMEYEDAVLYDPTLLPDIYEDNPMFSGAIFLPEVSNTATVYNTSLHWQQDGNLQLISNEIVDVLGININAFYRDIGANMIGEVQATHVRKMLPAFMQNVQYDNDGRLEYIHKTLTRFQQSNWREIGKYWAKMFKGDNEIPSHWDVDDIITQTNAVQGIIDKTPGLEVDTVFIRYGSLFNHKELKAGDISNFAGFAFSSYDSEDIYKSYQRGYDEKSERYRITILAPKGTKGISAGIQRYLEMWFHTNTGRSEFIHSLNQEFIVLSIDKVNHEVLVLLIDDDMKKKWMNR